MSGPSVATVLKITSPVPDPPVGAFLDHGHHELEDVSPAPGVPPIVLPPLNQEEIQLPTVLGIYSIVFKSVVAGISKNYLTFDDGLSIFNGGTILCRKNNVFIHNNSDFTIAILDLNRSVKFNPDKSLIGNSYIPLEITS